MHARRSGNAGEEDSQCEPWGRTSRARLTSPKGITNVNEHAVELTLVEHESKFSEVVADSVKTATLPKDILERLFDGSKSCLRMWVAGLEASSTHGLRADRQIRRRGRRCQCTTTALFV